MSRRALFASPTIVRLQTIIESIEAGELLFPEFQRPFVWSDKQRKRLLDSILKGLPIGSLLVWRTQGTLLQCKTKLGPFALPKPPTDALQHDYVLDGLQRLTTLYATLAGTVAEPFRDDEGRLWPIYFDLTKSLDAGDEGRFLIPTLREQPLPTWLPMPALFKGDLRWKHQQSLYEIGRHDLANKVEHLDRIFKDYSIAIVPIVTDDLALAATSFERINSPGTKMGEPQMLRALTYRRDFDLSTVLDEIRNRLPWPDVSQELLIRALKVIQGLDVYKAAPAQLIKPLQKDPTLVKKLENGLATAIKFLSEHCHIVAHSALPYTFQLIAIANASCKGVDIEQSGVIERLEAWMWITTYTEYFTGKTGDQLQHVFHQVIEVCQGASPMPTDIPRSCAPLDRFRASSVRSLMLMHLLARRQLRDGFGITVDGPRLVAYRPRAFAKLFPEATADDPANRILVDPLQIVSLRNALSDPTNLWSSQLRDAHLLPPWGEPRAADRDYVLSWRRERLQKLEADDLARLGLQVEEAPI